MASLGVTKSEARELIDGGAMDSPAPGLADVLMGLWDTYTPGAQPEHEAMAPTASVRASYSSFTAPLK